MHGTNFVTLTSDCSIHSASHDYVPIEKSEEITSIKDRIIELDDCYFNLNLQEIKQGNVKINKLASNDINELKDLTAEVAEQLNFWGNRIKYLPKFVSENKWFVSVMGRLILIFIAYIFIKSYFV